jgi:hypothetical protein
MMPHYRADKRAATPSVILSIEAIGPILDNRIVAPAPFQKNIDSSANWVDVSKILFSFSLLSLR